jgi:hypothetical protein
MKFIKHLSILFVLSISPHSYGQSVSQVIDDMDIDYQIRASEDPQFDQFIVEEKEQIRLEKQAAIYYKQKRQKERLRQKKLRDSFALQNEKRKLREERSYLRAQEQYEKRQKRIEKRNAQKEKRYAKIQSQKRAIEKQKQQALIARMHSRLSRMPASQIDLKKRKRIPPEKRLQLFNKIQERNRQERLGRR